MNKKLVLVLVVLALLFAVAAIGVMSNQSAVASNGPCDPGWAHLPGGPPGWSAACGGPDNVVAGNGIGPCQPGWAAPPGGANPPGFSASCGGPG